MTTELVGPVEFVAPGTGDDVLDLGGSPRAPKVWPGGVVLAALVAALVVLVADAGRLPAPVAVAVTRPVVGVVALPESPPRSLLSAREAPDTVWVLAGPDAVVQVVAGVVTASRRMAGPVQAVAVDDEAERVWVLTLDGGPAISVLQASTLALESTVRVPAGLTDLVAGPTAVYASGPGRLLELDPSTLRVRREIALPGIAEMRDLQVLRTLRGPLLTGLGRTRGGTMLVAVDLQIGDLEVRSTGPLTEPVQYASTLLGPWVLAGPNGTLAQATLYTTVLTPLLHTDTVGPGGRVWPYPEHGSWVSSQATDAVVVCHGPDGVPDGQVDLGETVGAHSVVGPLVRLGEIVYAATDLGLVRSGVGTCR